MWATARPVLLALLTLSLGWQGAAAQRRPSNLALPVSGAAPAGQAAAPAPERPAAAAPIAEVPRQAAAAPTAPPALEPAATRAIPGPSPAPEAGGGSAALGGGACPDAQAVLEAHNRERSATGAPPLTWSPSLAASAQQAAARCQLQPSGSGYGENLGAGSAWSTCAAAVPLWTAGRASYQAGSASPPQNALSWTQMVWKGSSELGCGFAQCPQGGLVVCQYNPPGNVAGAFQANV